MLSISSVLTSLLLASASATAAAVKARAICYADVAGKQLNIINGQYQLGYPAGSYFPDVPLEAEAVTYPFLPVFNVDPSGNGLLTFANTPAGSEVLYPTINANFTQVLLEPRITTYPANTTQTWFFPCAACDINGVSYGCQVQSAGTGQCALIGSAVGQTTGVESCTDMPYGNQVFTLYSS
ncbi:hypothetical protein B0H12DRAFT_1235693 [Mycena haematopus]|nr:hypothetical protein B0H12DRAFT_1235693 [Mycena haematopus]